MAQAKEHANEEREITIPPGPRLGDVVIRAEGIAKSYGDTVLYDNLMFDVPAGAIVGIIGPNGAGKTTLFRMIVGQEKPDAGALTVGSTVKLAYVDQSRADLIGQVLREGETTFESVSGLRLEIVCGGEKTYFTVTDAMGEFKISGMDCGTYDLRVELSEGSITVPQLPVTQP